jgi:ATP-binding cassette, subfamily G (WHITE), member 2
MLFFSGFLFRFDDIPDYWQWYSYIAFLRYAWSALMINQFDGETEASPNAGAPIQIAGLPILKYYGQDAFANAWESIGYEALFFVAFFGLAWAALQFSRPNKR